jgi:hypothetical protein
MGRSTEYFDFLTNQNPSPNLYCCLTITANIQEARKRYRKEREKDVKNADLLNDFDKKTIERC